VRVFARAEQSSYRAEQSSYRAEQSSYRAEQSSYRAEQSSQRPRILLPDCAHTISGLFKRNFMRYGLQVSTESDAHVSKPFSAILDRHR
jgi:hypothetical protein